MPTPAFTDLTSLAGIALALTTLLGSLPVGRRPGRPVRAIVLAGVAVLVLLPLGKLPVVAVVRGITGDLSVTTIVLLGIALFRILRGEPAARSPARIALLAAVALTALVLYPLSLGVGPFDPYRLGYGSPWLLGALLAGAVAAWFHRLDLIAVCLSLATLAWAVQWYESRNLWDYLIDPLLSVYALGASARLGVLWLMRRIRAPRLA